MVEDRDFNFPKNLPLAVTCYILAFPAWAILAFVVIAEGDIRVLLGAFMLAILTTGLALNYSLRHKLAALSIKDGKATILIGFLVDGGYGSYTTLFTWHPAPGAGRPDPGHARLSSVRFLRP